MKQEIWHGDCLELMKNIPDGSVDMVLTDPPYGVNYQNNYTKNKHKKIINDELPFSYKSFLDEAYRVLKNNSAIFCFTGWSTYPRHFLELQEAGFKTKEPLIVQKRASGTTDLRGSFQTNSDWIMFGHKGRFIFSPTSLVKNKKAGCVPNVGRKPVPEFKTRFFSAWFGEEYPWASENSSFQKSNGIYHPTIKSVKFLEWVIQLGTKDGDIVLDCFAGSGSTGVAAKNLNRQFILIEKEKEYYDICVERLK